MPSKLRLLQSAAAPLVFVAVALLSWWLVSTHLDARTPEVCAVEGAREPPPLETSRASVEQQASAVAPASVSEPTALHSVAASHSLSMARPEEPEASFPPVEGEEARAEPELAVLLDGGVGPRPATLMNCSFDGGTFRCGECMTDSDCAAGQGCVINYRKSVFECAASECEEDQHCFPGTVCRVAAGAPPGPVIRRCLLAGARGEGETCSPWPATREQACQEGLLCVHYVCGRPCALGEPGTCAEGFVCEEGSSGAACLRDCRKLGCAAGKQCAQVNEGPYQCLDLVVDECGEDRPCATGKHCMVRGLFGRAGRFCAASCQSWNPASCPEGYVCGRGGPTLSACYRRCDPNDLSTCPNGWICMTVTEDLQTWGCHPNPH
jgi:hypothetical protein